MTTFQWTYWKLKKFLSMWHKISLNAHFYTILIKELGYNISIDFILISMSEWENSKSSDKYASEMFFCYCNFYIKVKKLGLDLHFIHISREINSAKVLLYLVKLILIERYWVLEILKYLRTLKRDLLLTNDENKDEDDWNVYETKYICVDFIWTKREETHRNMKIKRIFPL